MSGDNDQREDQRGNSERTRLSPRVLLALLLAGLIALFLGSFLIGRYPVSPLDACGILLSKVIAVPQTWTGTMETVVWNVRLPRILAAMLAGMALAVSGAAYQNLFRNPLVSSDILGVSHGAGFGAALAMVLHLGWFWIQLLAFAGGVAAVACSLSVGSVVGNRSVTSLVLGGMAVSALFQALLSVMKYVADPMETLPGIVFWLMGGFAKATAADILRILPVVLPPAALLFAFRWQINVLGAGEEEAHTLGVNVRLLRVMVVLCATLMTAGVVSVCGVVGWVGLVIPHMARMLVGANFATLLPVTMLLGGGFMLLADDLCRSLISLEIPVGILTALIGAPFFIFLLARSRKAWV